MYIPLSDDKHWFVRDSSLCALEIQDNVRDNFFLTIFFEDKNFFQQKIFFSDFFLDWILSWTGICLGLHPTVVFRMQSFNLYLVLHWSNISQDINYSMVYLQEASIILMSGGMWWAEMLTQKELHWVSYNNILYNLNTCLKHQQAHSKYLKIRLKLSINLTLLIFTV